MTDGLRRWKGKVALVTGASGGIGWAIATALADHGLRVAVAGRRADRLDTLVRRLARQGADTRALVGDLAEAKTARGLVRRVVAEWGRINVLVNNAGTGGDRGLCRATVRGVEQCFDVNVRAAFLCMQEAVRTMDRAKDAAIINVGSMAGHRLPPARDGGSSVAYAASKHALRVMTEGLRTELAAQGSQIKVALISPGMVDTAWHSAHRAPDRRHAFGFTPLQPADVARAVLFVLSMPRRAQVCDVWLRPVGQVF